MAKPKNGNWRQHPASFKPGNSGNPKGRPKKGESFSEQLRFWLEKDNCKERNIIVRHLAKTKPEVLLHYAYGKPLESVELSGKDGEGLFDSLAVAVAQQIHKTK